MNNILNQHTGIFLRDVTIVAAWLLLLATENRQGGMPITSIFPYLIPVVFMAWRHGLFYGFVFAGIASIAAMPENYMESHDMKDLYWAGFTTYLKISCAIVGVAYGRRLANSK